MVHSFTLVKLVFDICSDNNKFSDGIPVQLTKLKGKNIWNICLKQA